jgi:hypothetical protein
LRPKQAIHKLLLAALFCKAIEHILSLQELKDSKKKWRIRELLHSLWLILCHGTYPPPWKARDSSIVVVRRRHPVQVLVDRPHHHPAASALGRRVRCHRRHRHRPLVLGSYSDNDSAAGRQRYCCLSPSKAAGTYRDILEAV